MPFIYHICLKEDWEVAPKTGSYSTRSLAEEGFIHCSRMEQIPEVARRFFPGVPNLVLLEIDPDKLAAELRWEQVDDQHFPHIYGPINLDAIRQARDFQFPDN